VEFGCQRFERFVGERNGGFVIRIALFGVNRQSCRPRIMTGLRSCSDGHPDGAGTWNRRVRGFELGRGKLVATGLKRPRALVEGFRGSLHLSRVWLSACYRRNEYEAKHES